MCRDFKLNSTSLPSYHINCPKQTNGTDCGLFLLENVETFLESPEFVLKDVNQKSGIMYQKRFIDEKREHVKRIIIAMAEKTKVKADGELDI